jgi:hypothetical protein
MKLEQINKLTTNQLSYIAGFLDGDGSIMVQIVKNKTYKYGHTIRVTVSFYQKTKRHWFMIKLRKMLGLKWSIRKGNNGISEVSRTGFTPIKNFLILIKPHLILKPRLALLVLQIIEEYSQVQSEADFLEVCKKIDKTAEYTDSKKRKHTYSSVQNYLNSPVETEKTSS